MAYNVDTHEIIDPNNGKGDISKKIIKAVGEPIERFREDPLRLLRAVRIANELDFRIEANTLEAISKMSDQIAFVAPERIRNELMKILLNSKPSKAFYFMKRVGLLDHFLPELVEGYLKKQNTYHRYTIFRHVMETIDSTEAIPILRLTALLHDIAKPRVRKKLNGVFRFYNHEKESARLAREIMIRLRFNGEMVKNVTNLIMHHMIEYGSDWSDGAVRRLIQRVGPSAIDKLILFRKADLIAHGTMDDKMSLLFELEKRVSELTRKPYAGSLNDLAINGNHVSKILGLAPGPIIGKILKELMEKVIDDPKKNTKSQLIAMVHEMNTDALNHK